MSDAGIAHHRQRADVPARRHGAGDRQQHARAGRRASCCDSSDTFAIAGCPFVIGPVPHPVRAGAVGAPGRSGARRPATPRSPRQASGCASPPTRRVQGTVLIVMHPATGHAGSRSGGHDPHRLRLPVPDRPGLRPGAAQSPYATHVDQMIRQVLLTTPGERADLPEFGCGLRQLLFAPNSDALQATTQLIVQHSLSRWLGEPDHRCRRHRRRRAPAATIRRSSCRSTTLLMETQSHAADPGLVSLTWPAATAAPRFCSRPRSTASTSSRSPTPRRRCCASIS